MFYQSLAHHMRRPHATKGRHQKAAREARQQFTNHTGIADLYLCLLIIGCGFSAPCLEVKTAKEIWCWLFLYGIAFGTYLLLVRRGEDCDAFPLELREELDKVD